MNSIFRLIGLDFSGLKRRGLWMVGGGVLAAIFAALMFEFLAVALYVTLDERMTALSAALIVAGVAFVLCLITLAVTTWAMGRAKRELNSAVKTSAIAAFSPTMVRLAARHTGVAGAVAVIVATLAYMEGRRK
jgi:Na+-transporting methylmalonyl-CoA/oxaloacetate decarboxylase gamma subunit